MNNELQNEKELIQKFIEEAFNSIDSNIKEVSKKIYGDDFRTYLEDIMLSTIKDIKSPIFSDIENLIEISKSVNKKYQQHLKSKNVQKNRWLNNSIKFLENNDGYAQSFYIDNHKDEMDYNEFKSLYIKKVKEWSTINCTMIEFPFYSYLGNKSSYTSAIRYDVKEYTYKTLLDTLLEYEKYTQSVMLLGGFFTPKRDSRNKLQLEYQKNDNDIIIITGKNEQMSLLNSLDLSSLDKDKQKLLKETIEKEYEQVISSEIIETIIKNNKIFLQTLDTEDFEIINCVLSRIDKSFYITRNIKVTEQDLLIGLEKPLSNPRYRKNLRSRIDKIQSKTLVKIDPNEDDVIKTKKTGVFQSIEYIEGVKNKSLNTYIFRVNEDLYETILHKDTISVYKNDFLSLKSSDFPTAILLVFQLQLIRFSCHQLGTKIYNLDTSFFIKHLYLEKKDTATTVNEIKKCLNEFTSRSIILKDYKYDSISDSWDCEFFELSSEDLTLLLNNRKDYNKLVNNNNILNTENP